MADFFSQNSAINQAIQASNFRNSLNNRALFEQQAAQKRLMGQSSALSAQRERQASNDAFVQRQMAQNQIHEAKVAADRMYNLQSKLASSSSSGSASQDKALAAQSTAQDKSISAADRARGDTLAAQDRGRRETLTAQATSQDKSISAADRARGDTIAASDRSRKETLAAQDRARADTIAAQDRGRREGLEGQSRLQSERFTQQSKLQSQAAAEAKSNKESDRTAAMQAFMRFRKGA